MSQIPNITVRFAFTVGRTIIEDDAILGVGFAGFGAWAALNALACENDGRFKGKTALVRLSEMGDVPALLQVLQGAGLIVQVADEPGWWYVQGWHKWQRPLPKSGTQRSRDSRNAVQRPAVAATAATTATTIKNDDDNDHSNDNDNDDGTRVGSGVTEFRGPHGSCEMEGVHVHVKR